MKRYLSFVVLPLLVAMIVSCESSPGWVRAVPGEKDGLIFFVGAGRTAKTITAKKGQAQADALGQLTRWKETTVSQALRDYVDESGETENTQSIESFLSAVNARSKANLSGFKQVETWTAKDGHIEMLFSYPINDYRNDVKAATNEFVRNESAAFAEFKADVFFKTLDAELEKK